MTAVSIIIPAYKRVAQTIQTINLLRASNRLGTDFEIEIVVADSTPDTSLEEALKKQFGDSIRYARPEKQGVASNKNCGAKIARHTLLIFCDSDMEVEPETVFNTLTALYTHKTAAMVGGQVRWKGGAKDGQIDRPRPEDRIEKIETTSYTEAIYSRFFATYKDVFWQVGGYDEIAFNMRGEGSDLSIRYWRAGFPLIYQEEIKVHHVHDAPDSVALRVDHPEWGVAKDLLLLAYKYDMLGQDYPNFSQTVAANFEQFGNEGYFRLLQGIGKQLDLISQVKPTLDQFRTLPPVYAFSFLEVFTNHELFNKCVQTATERLQPVRNTTFT
jgi:GT2 family glycosyltransferase